MKLRDFRRLTDENLDPVVVEWLCDAGVDVLDVVRDGMQGTSDVELLRRSAAERRAIVTHDADFGRLAVLQGEPVAGILFVRPGHFDPLYTIDTLIHLLSVDPDLTSPFLVVARRRAGRLDIRIRGLP